MTLDPFMLAQAASQPEAESAAPVSPMESFLRMWLPLILMVVVFYWLIFRGQKKERDRHSEMLKAMKRNDRVQTIGGIYGTVVEVRDSEVILKVDETNNVKMRFNRGAIKEVLSEVPTPDAKK